MLALIGRVKLVSRTGSQELLHDFGRVHAGAFAVILQQLNCSLGYVYEIMGVLIGSAVAPIAMVRSSFDHTPASIILFSQPSFQSIFLKNKIKF